MQKSSFSWEVKTYTSQVSFHQNMISQQMFKLEKIPIEYNPVDMGTKVLLVGNFKVCKNLLNIEVGWFDETL